MTQNLTIDDLAKLHNESYSTVSAYYSGLTDSMREIRKKVLSFVLEGKEQGVVSIGPKSVRGPSLSPLPKDSRILDVGCALGDNLALMSQEGFNKLTGIDIAHGMIEEAQKRFSAEWICEDFMQHNSSEKYDLVFAQALIHLFPKKMVKEVFLRLFSLSNKRVYFSTTIHELASEGIEPKGEVQRYRSRYTLPEILALAQELLTDDPNLSFHYLFLTDHLGKFWINGVFERQDIQKIYQKDGVLLYKQLVNPEIVHRASSEIDSLRTTKPTPGTYLRYDGEKTFDRVENFLPFCSEGLRHILQNTRVDRIIKALLGEEAVLLKDKINYKMPGMGAFIPHQDAAAGWDQYGDTLLSFCFSFDQSTEENGALYFTCGEHTKGLLSPIKTALSEAVIKTLHWIQVFTNPGDALFFDSYTPHYSEDNQSAKQRRMAFLTYHARKFGDHRTVFFEAKRNRQPPMDERAFDANMVRDSFGKLIYKE
ncbi:MAG: phytanoyl-CoA dioxygenase family protein [Parachlamydiaceae bacterium]|nr:phytanoyl-CoA dioxygenase family protein [Parachlamydiaceae bacterium]